MEIWEKRDAWAPLRKKGSFGRGIVGERSEREQRKSSLAVVVVDPFSTGALLAAKVVSRGYHCIRVLSTVNSPVGSLVQEGLNTQYDATVQHHPDGLARTIKKLEDMPWDIVAIVPGAETGVLLADQLSKR